MVERKKLIAMVRGAQQGDDEAAAELYDNFYSDIYYHIMKTVNHPELAADLTQDTYIEILSTISKLEEPAAFVTWAKQIAYHRCTAYFRKSHELLADEDEDGYSVFDTIEEDRDEFIPGEALDKEDLKKAIHDIINALPPEQRSALLMRYFEEISVKEIAEIQGVTEGTVKSRLNYARKAVKQSVEEYEKKHDIKLHSIGILPLLLWLFGQYQKAGLSFGAGAAATAVGTATAGAAGVATGTGAAGAATATGAAATAAGTAGTAAAVGVAGAAAGTVATAATAGTAAAVGTALATKIVAGIVAVAVAVGGATTAVVISRNSAEQTPPTISADQPLPIEELEFTISKDGTAYEVTGIGTFKGTKLVIPAEYNGVPVKAIKERAFYECKQLTSVSIPGSVESIGSRAFQLCENIESLTLSEGIQRIESGAFSKCYALTSIHIPASVTDIGSFAFDMCFGAEQITVATDNAVYHSSGNCLIDTAEKSIIAACGNSVIPTDGSVDKIGEGGFNGYDNETLVLPDCITSIGDSAFSGSTIKEVVIPGSVTTMGTYIFGGCTSLTTATFEEGVTGINSAAFSYCPSLHAVYIPVSVLYIDSSAFSLCESLNDIYYAGTMAQWQQIWDIPLWFTVHCTDGDILNSPMQSTQSRLNYVLSNDGAYYTIVQGSYGEGEVILPAEYNGLPVTTIGNNAFSSCSDMTSVTLPDSITSIELFAFGGCSNLTSAILPESLTYIGEGMFAECTNLTSVNIPNAVTRINTFAFYECSSLTSINIPAGVTNIRYGAFMNCSNLSDIYYAGTTQQWNAIEKESSWNDYTDNYVIHCTDGDIPVGLEFTLSADGSSYEVTGISHCTVTSVVIPAEYNGLPVTAIGVWAFEDCYNLTSVTIPDSIITIDNGAFIYCRSLTDIKIPNSVTYLGAQAFFECDSLADIVLPDRLTVLYDSTFYSCESLTKLHIPASVTSIPGNPINCTSVNEITVAENNPNYHSAGNCLIETATKTLIAGCNSSIIPSDGSVTAIAINAFDGCNELASITIPSVVTEISYAAVARCDGLETITVADGNPVYHSAGNCIIETATNTLVIGCKNSVIPSDGSVTRIQKDAFALCINMENFHIPNGVTEIGDDAFYYCPDINSIFIPDSVISIGARAFFSCRSLSDIYYAGTIEQWNAITKGDNWDRETGWGTATGSYTIHCTDGDIPKS